MEKKVESRNTKTRRKAGGMAGSREREWREIEDDGTVRDIWIYSTVHFFPLFPSWYKGLGSSRVLHGERERASAVWFYIENPLCLCLPTPLVYVSRKQSRLPEARPLAFPVMLLWIYICHNTGSIGPWCFVIYVFTFFAGDLFCVSRIESRIPEAYPRALRAMLLWLYICPNTGSISTWRFVIFVFTLFDCVFSHLCLGWVEWRGRLPDPRLIHWFCGYVSLGLHILRHWFNRSMVFCNMRIHPFCSFFASPLFWDRMVGSKLPDPRLIRWFCVLC